MGSYIKNYEIISDPFVELEEHQHKFDKLKKAINEEKRIFRIDRIKKLKLTAETYKLPDDFSLAEERDNAWGVELNRAGSRS